MRISDWSSDVCSSDLLHAVGPVRRLSQREHDSGGSDQARGRLAKSPRSEVPVRRSARPASWFVGRRRQACGMHVRRAQSRDRTVPFARSEEHTSELQSLMRISYAVFCLKKKKHKKILSPIILKHHFVY